MMKRLYVPGLALCLLAACGSGADEPGGTSAPVKVAGAVTAGSGPFTFKGASLPDFFDCMRAEGGTVVAAHRGGPAPGYPENAIATFEHTLKTATPVLEIDVSESRDGVLFLFHDRTLTRLTDGSGYVSDTDWAVISALSLRDEEGNLTPYHPPTLREALVWAKENGAILELDKKETTSLRNIVSAVRETGAEANVIVITYTDAQAIELSKLAPDLMFTASARSAADLQALAKAGVNLSNMVAWTGTDAPDKAAWAALEAEGVEPAFGTLGRRGERLDDAYGARDYRGLVESGVRLIATDRPGDVARFLTADDTAFSTCNR